MMKTFFIKGPLKRKMRLFLIVISTLIFSFFITSCKKEEVVVENYLKIDSELYPLINGTIVYSDILRQSQNSCLSVSLKGKPETIHIDPYNICYKQQTIEFDLYTTKGNIQGNGEYLFMDDKIQDFSFANLLISITDTLCIQKNYKCKVGKVEIQSNESTFEIYLDATSSEDQKIKAYYKGILWEKK